MSDQTPRLSLPYIQAAQAQKHVTHNEAIEQLDMLVQLTVVDFGATTPSASPVDGEAWEVGTGATGAWAGHDGQIASWRNGGWAYVTPAPGWRAYSTALEQILIYDGTAWAPAPDPIVNTTDMLGINATADTTNRLAVAAPATLLNHAGAGHQLKLNKAAQADTASLLYQSNWSGRAEMGLTGTDDFSIKVSADGANFATAVQIDAPTGKVQFPQGTAGSGSTAGALGLQAIVITGERSGNLNVGSYLAYGNGSSQNSGVAMPFAGSVVAATLAQRDASAATNTLTVTINRVEATGYSVSQVTTGADTESGVANFQSAPLHFSAGDMLGMKITAASASSGGTIGSLFVIFD